MKVCTEGSGGGVMGVVKENVEWGGDSRRLEKRSNISYIQEGGQESSEELQRSNRRVTEEFINEWTQHTRSMQGY